MSPDEVIPVLLSSTSVGLAVGAFLHGWRTGDRQDKSLVHLWKRATAAGAIPTSVTLIICSFRPSLLNSIPGLNLPIALGGLSLLYICLEALETPQTKPPIKDLEAESVAAKKDLKHSN
jgi:hypothetical protein